MAIQLDFSSAEAQRLKITQEQQEYIRDLYKQASAKVGKLAEQAPRVPSDALRQQYLHTLQGQIDSQLRDIEKQLNGTIRSGMTDTAKATVADAKSFLKEAGLPIKGAYSHVPADIVRSVASGQLYTGNWTLSRALWLNTAETQHDVQSVIAQGIIQNKSAYAIAKDLEKYVDPDARKDWEWSKVYPGTKKVVDYNAQRLARTMVSHAYQQAFVRTTQKNPFVSKYKWEASNSGRVCEICEERDGKLFDKDELPLDHPNGMCTFTAVMDNLDTIGERLGDWANGKDDPEIDKWVMDLRGYGQGSSGKEKQLSELPDYSPIKMTFQDWERWAIDPEPFQDALLEGEMPKYLMGEKLSTSEAERVAQAARQIQVEALTHRQKGVNTVYRGESYDSLDLIRSIYRTGQQYTTNKLTSTTTDRSIAQEYASMGERKYSLLQIISSPQGIRGVVTDPMGTGGSAEIITPIGNTYKVTSIDINEESGIVKVYMFDYGNKPLSKKEAVADLSSYLGGN